jgi:hypothetical protein
VEARYPSWRDFLPSLLLGKRTVEEANFWGIRVLYRWVFVSQARLHEEQGEKGISDIVGVSRIRNVSLGVTGALIFAGDRFAQLLEGAESNVVDLQNRILRDTRHSMVTPVQIDLQPRRLFADWFLQYAGRSLFFGNILNEIELDSQTQERSSAQLLSTLFTKFAQSYRNS